MSLEEIDPQFRMDAAVAPTFKCDNYNSEERTFDVFFNDGTLKNDEWYGPLQMDLDSLKPETEEPLLYQIAQQVYSAVEKGKLEECDMSSTTLVLSGMLGQVQTVPMEALMKHKEAMAKQNIQNVDPVVSATTVVNVYSEDDFDEQFEALSKALSEEE
tara:strand:+ start:2222 stop:2695 length:474 start_codon:yes stop_codon:yes gene_type:complete